MNAPSPAAPDDASRLVGAVLNGRWQLQSLLGEGGMGAVYAAVNPTGARAAVKILHAEFRLDPQIVSRFFSEAEVASRMVHAGIARVYEAAAAEDGTPYMVMEIIEGQTLTALLAPRKPLSLAFTGAATRRMLEAISFAHARGVVHRDLKPDNVFVKVLASEDAAVKIVDFGLAKVMDLAGGLGSRTRTGMLLGTPGYMSPEQITNARTVDPRSDLFSIAVMAFEMLSGADPYPAANPFERITKVLMAEPPRISDSVSALASFDAFFQRALAKKPDDRFSTAEEMANALTQTIANATSVQTPFSTLVSPSTASPERRHHSTKMSEMVPGEFAPPATISPDQVQIVPPAPLAPAKSGSGLWPLIALVSSLLCLAIGVLIGYLIAHGS